MRTRLLLVAAVLAALAALGACTTDDDSAAPSPSGSETASSSAPADEPGRLPTGKDDLALEATSYVSPEGFAPELRLDLQFSGLVGWTSVHRGADGFDLGLPDPQADAPLVAVAFLVPAEPTAEEALASVRRSATEAGAQVRDVTGPFEALGATAGVDVVGGQGQVVASGDGGIALDAVPGGRLQVLATDAGGSPMLVVAFAPDASTWSQARDVLDRLSGAIAFA